MRLNITPSRHTFKLENAIYERKVTESIIINYKPEGEFDLINKSLSDSYIERLDLNRLETIFSKSLFPNYKGHFDKIKNEWYFNHTTKAKSNDAQMSINKYGFITSSQRKLPKNTIDNFGFEKIDRNSFPNKVENLGITNSINLTGTGIVNGGLIYKDLSNRSDSPLTPKKIRNFLNPKEIYEIGDIILVKSDVDMSNTSFRKLNGSILKVNDYPILAEKLGESYGLNLGTKMTRGHPWKITHYLTPNNTDLVRKPDYVVLNIPELNNLGGAAMFATKNKIFVCGGFRGDRRKPLSSVYRITLNEEGYPVKTERISDMPEPRIFSKAVAFCNYVHLIGGTKDPMKVTDHSTILRCKINDDGDIVGWYFGEKLPYEFSRCLPYVVGDRLYVLGGVRHTGSSMVNGVLVSKEEALNKRVWTFINLDGTLKLPIKEDEEDEKYGSSEALPVGYWIDLAFTHYREDGKLQRVSIYSNINNRSSVRNYEQIVNFGTKDRPSVPMASVKSLYNRTIYGLVGLRSSGTGIFSKGFTHIIPITRNVNNGMVKPGDVENIVKENDVTRSYHDCVVTNAGMFFLSGVTNFNPLENRENGIISKPVLVKTQIGMQDYMSWIKLNKNPDTVTLPLVDDTVFKGETYSYYIKVE